MDDKHIVLLWVAGQSYLTIRDAAVIRRELFAALAYPHVWVRFEGVRSISPEFIAHTLGALYWKLSPEELRAKFSMLGVGITHKPVIAKGLEIARLEVTALMREMGGENA